jgi:hypothetical protein
MSRKPAAMKLFCLLPLLLCQAIWAQTNESTSRDNDLYRNVSGNPYLIKDWSEGKVKFANGRIMNQFRLKFDCVRNMLLMQFEGSMFPADNKVSEFILYPKGGKKTDSMVFRKGFPGMGKHTGDTYYQVLYAGQHTLLRLIVKNIIEDRTMIVTTTSYRTRLEEAESYYLLKDGSLIHLSDDKSDWLKQLGAKGEPLAAYMDAQHVKLKTPEDYILVAKKLDEL